MTSIRHTATEFPARRLQRLFILRRERKRERVRRVLTTGIVCVVMALCLVLLAGAAVSCLSDR